MPVIWLAVGKKRRDFIEDKRNSLLGGNLKSSFLSMSRFFDFLRDYLIKEGERARSLVVKLSAETGLLYNIAVGMIFMMIIANWLGNIKGLTFLPIGILITLLFGAGIYRSIRLWRKMVSMLESISQKQTQTNKTTGC